MRSPVLSARNARSGRPASSTDGGLSSAACHARMYPAYREGVEAFGFPGLGFVGGCASATTDTRKAAVAARGPRTEERATKTNPASDELAMKRDRPREIETNLAGIDPR
jgi:hypothetical protein